MVARKTLCLLLVALIASLPLRAAFAEVSTPAHTAHDRASMVEPVMENSMASMVFATCSTTRVQELAHTHHKKSCQGGCGNCGHCAVISTLHPPKATHPVNWVSQADAVDSLCAAHTLRLLRPPIRLS